MARRRGARRGRGHRAGVNNPGINPRLWQMIQRGSRRFGLDPYAVAAVSRVEGGGTFGAVGDQGTSFGPFQLHRGGALPAGRGAAWANSRPGVMYAMRKMAESGASGKRGKGAINAIVRNFERPADPDTEVQRALALYRQAGGGPQSEIYAANVAATEKKHRAMGPGGVSPIEASRYGLIGKVGPLSKKAADFSLGQLQEIRSQAQVDQAHDRGSERGQRPSALAAGGGWGGSEGIVMGLTKGLNLATTSAKRDRKNTSSGGVSDHWVGSKHAFANDLGGSVDEMDRAAAKLARRLGIKYKRGQPLVATVNRNGYRIQVLYRTNIGGNHFDHIHVGVRRL